MKRAFLYALIASVALCALLGTWAILSRDLGWLQVRILLTTVAVAGASICGLACGAYLATGRGRALPLAGIALALAGAALVIAGIWTEARWEGYWKLAASIPVLAVACAHLALLSMARLAQSFRWSLPVAYVAILGVASLTVLAILGEIDESGMFRLLGVAAILDAAITILIPIFHRLSRGEVAAGSERPRLEAIDAEIAALRERIAELERMKQAIR